MTCMVYIPAEDKFSHSLKAAESVLAYGYWDGVI